MNCFTSGPGQSLTIELNLEETKMSLRTLEDAFVDELRDLLSAEKQLAKALPKMAKSASSDQLRAAIEHHLQETKHQIERLDQVFSLLKLTARAKKCDAMAGLLEEGNTLLEEDATPDVKDALIIAAAQKIEHYEIATYGTLISWAKLLGHANIADILKETMSEEVDTDSLLSEIAESVNIEAMAGIGAEEEE